MYRTIYCLSSILEMRYELEDSYQEIWAEFSITKILIFVAISICENWHRYFNFVIVTWMLSMISTRQFKSDQFLPLYIFTKKRQKLICNCFGNRKINITIVWTLVGYVKLNYWHFCNNGWVFECPWQWIWAGDFYIYLKQFLEN